MTILTTDSCLNPFFVNGRQLNNIIFYNEKGVLFETQHGWFGNGNNVFKSFDLVDEIKTKKVTSLEKLETLTENFVVSVKADYLNDKRYDLYLYVDGKNISIDKEEIKEEKISSTQIRKYVTRTLTIYNKKIDLDDTLEFIKTDFGKKVEEIDKELSKVGISISRYDLEQLLKHYDLVKRS